MESFTIPDIYCPFPLLISPHLEDVQRHTLKWLQGIGLIHGTARQRFLEFGAIACRAHAKGGQEELFVISDWYSWICVYDDLLDEGDLWRQPESLQVLQEHLLDVLQASPLSAPQGPLAKGLADIWQRASSLTSPDWQGRFALHHADFFAAQRQEAENRRHNRIPNLEAYINNRRLTGAAVISCDLEELAARIEISPDIYEDQPFQDVLQAIHNIGCWNNDVYSLQKDLAHGEINNLVVIVQHIQGGSLQEAVNHVCAMTETETRRFQEMVQHFPSYSATVDRDIHNFLVTMGSSLRGALDWHRKSLRYKRKRS